MLRSFKFPFVFDAAQLVTDYERVNARLWREHFNPTNYQGKWSALALRAAPSSRNSILPLNKPAAEYRDTPLLDECPYIKEVLRALPCPMQAVRLMKLAAGSVIKEHSDNRLDYEDGLVRLHIPITTAAEVYFVIDGERIVLAPGECWYTNVNRPHSVANRSGIDRVHLVADCEVNEWLRGFLEPARRECYRIKGRSASERHVAVAWAAERLDFAKLTRALNDFGSQDESICLIAEGSAYQLEFRASEPVWRISVELDPVPELNAELTDSKEVVETLLFIESSPDPKNAHAQEFLALLRILNKWVPGLVVRRGER